MNEDYVGLEDLKNSIAPMTSDDWLQRFIAEYAQLTTRIGKLLDILWSDDVDQLNCPSDILDMQAEAMMQYRRFLEIRAELYGINLEKEIEKLNR